MNCIGDEGAATAVAEWRQVEVFQGGVVLESVAVGLHPCVVAFADVDGGILP